jgi:hypothetical protein
MERGWGCVLLALIALAAFCFVINPAAHLINDHANEVAANLN